MAPTSIEVKVISCKGLKVFNFFQKLSTYATISIVSLDPNNHRTVKKRYQQQKTPIDRDGDGNPEWNHQTEFDLNQIESDESSLHGDHLFLQFDILCEGGLFGDKTIGLVRVPIKDLIEEGTGAVRFVCYQVMTSDGKPNDGVLDFSYKVIGAEIGNNYPVVSSVQSLYPPLESILYPPPPPIPQVYYPPPPEAFYASPPHLPAAEVYYPTPPPPMTHYPVPPSSYAPPAYSCHECRYPTVDPY